MGSAKFAGGPPSADRAGLWYTAPGKPPVGFVFEDQLRPDAAKVIATLRTSGYAVELLSGDTAARVAEVAGLAGIVDARGGQSPVDKIARLATLKSNGRRVLMVGDGLNDAPALAAGHASLSPSGAAEISQTVADVIWQGASLLPLLELLGVARQSRRMALQNFAIAIGYNAVFVPLAVAGLVTPLIAALAMSTSSIVVTANAVRLRHMPFEGSQLMTALAWLMPCALLLGLLGLLAFLWALRSGQFEDLEGAGWRALDDNETASVAQAALPAIDKPVVQSEPTSS